MKRIYPRILLLTLLLSSGLMSAQYLTPSVVSSSGGFYSSGQGMLSFTTGELAVTETFANATGFLTQGFQQPWDLGTSTDQTVGFDLSYQLFPNPSDGLSYFRTLSKDPLQFHLRLTDLLGREMMELHFNQQTEYNTQELDLTKYPSGMYIISLHVRLQQTEAHNLIVIPITIVK